MTPQPRQKVSPTCWNWAEMRDFCFSQAMKVVRNPETADDAAQEAIIRAWRHRDRCRQPEQPFGWLRRIAHNEAVRAAGRRPGEVLVDEPLTAPAAQTDEPEFVHDRLLFSSILGTLSQADQELALLRYYDDLTCAALAEHLGQSEATVKVRLHRLRRRLRQRLEDGN